MDEAEFGINSLREAVYYLAKAVFGDDTYLRRRNRTWEVIQGSQGAWVPVLAGPTLDALEVRLLVAARSL